jgi:hypothetical protein
MESIVGESTFLRVFRHVVIVGVVTTLFLGCSPHDVRDDSFTIHFVSGNAIAIGKPGDVIITAADGTVDFFASIANQE